MKKTGVGILGCGVISRTYVADIKNFFKDLEIVSCADVSVDFAKKLAEEFGIKKAYSVDELLSDDEVSIVVNLTPPKFHFEVSKKIIESGKNLFSEKPFTPTLKEAMEIRDLAKDKGVKIAGAPDTFLSSGLQSMRYYLDNGMIGKPFSVTANMTCPGHETWHPNAAFYYDINGGPVYDMAPYYLSALVSLLGPIDTISAYCATPKSERYQYCGPNAGAAIEVKIPTSYAIILQHKSGVMVSMNMSFDVFKSSLPAFEIYGDEGTLTYPDPNYGGGTPKVYRKEQYTDVVYQDNEASQERKAKFYELPELFTRAKDYSRGLGVLDLADAIQNDRDPRAGGDYILHVTEAIEGICKCANSGSQYKMQTSCERPAPLKPGAKLCEV